MADFPTFNELFRVARDEMLTRNSDLTLDVIEREGTDANALTAGQAAVGDEVIAQLAEVEASLFLDSAEKKKLDRLVFDRYGLLRKPASPALVSVEFTTTDPAPAAFSIPAGTRLSTSDGKQFLTLAAASFSAGSTGPVTVACRSALAGLSQAVRKNQINSIVSQISGAPNDLSVNNTVASSGADDAELDPALRDRARRFFTTARRGTLAAIENGALAVSGVRTAAVFEALDQYGRPARSTQLVVSDAFTETLIDESTVPVSYQTQSQLLAQQVFDALWDVRAAGMYVAVTLGAIVLQGVTLGLAFQAGVNVDLVAFRARVAIVNYINGLPPGSHFRVDDAITALRSVSGLVISGGEILSPAGDIIVTPIQVIRTTTALVVATSVQPDSALQGNTNPDGV